MNLHYFAKTSQEALAMADAICTCCGTPDAGDCGWWEIAGQPVCTGCTMLAEEVAEAAGEPLVIGQILTIAQQDALAEWNQAGINTH